MDKIRIDILKYIARHPETDNFFLLNNPHKLKRIGKKYEAIEIDEAVTFLVENKYLNGGEDFSFERHCPISIVNLGKDYLYDRHKIESKFWITQIIAALALIKSFLPELALIWKLIAQVWQ